jgi:hypothetical protein
MVTVTLGATIFTAASRLDARRQLIGAVFALLGLLIAFTFSGVNRAQPGVRSSGVAGHLPKGRCAVPLRGG